MGHNKWLPHDSLLLRWCLNPSPRRAPPVKRVQHTVLWIHFLPSPHSSSFRPPSSPPPYKKLSQFPKNAVGDFDRRTWELDLLQQKQLISLANFSASHTPSTRQRKATNFLHPLVFLRRSCIFCSTLKAKTIERRLFHHSKRSCSLDRFVSEDWSDTFYRVPTNFIHWGIDIITFSQPESRTIPYCSDLISLSWRRMCVKTDAGLLEVHS